MPVPDDIKDILGVKKPEPPRSPWRRLIDGIIEGAVNSPLGAEPVARQMLKNKGHSAEEINAGERRLIEDLAAKRQAENEGLFADVDTLSPANIGKHAVDLMGNIIGGADPTYVIAPGRGPATRIASQAGINAGVDVVNQGVQLARDIRDEYDLLQTGISAAAGVGVQGAQEVAKALRGKLNLDINTAKTIGNKFGTVTSTLRSPERNKKVGGAKNSHHLRGNAIDIARGKGVTHKQLERAYRRAGYEIIESLDEGDHSHFAFKFGAKPKKGQPVIEDFDFRPPEERAEIIDLLKDREPIADRAPILDSSHEKFTPYVERPNDPANDMRSMNVSPEEVRNLEETMRVRMQEMEDEFGPDWDKPKDVLTPAERQEMDASAVRPDIPPITPAGLGRGLSGDPANDVNVHSIADARQQKDLKDFHKSLMSSVSDRVRAAKELVAKVREEGLLPFEVGDRFTTPKGRKLNQGPWKVAGYYADPKDPNRYGYRVERGSKEADDYESAIMLVSDPKADAERIKRGWEPFDRTADVTGWKKLGTVREADVAPPPTPPGPNDPDFPAPGTPGNRGGPKGGPDEPEGKPIKAFIEYERVTGRPVGPITMRAIFQVADENGLSREAVADLYLRNPTADNPIAHEIRDLRDMMAGSEMSAKDFEKYKKLPQGLRPKQPEVKKYILEPSPATKLSQMEPGENNLGGLVDGVRYTNPSQMNPDIRYGAAINKDGQYFRWEEKLQKDGSWKFRRWVGATDSGYGPTDEPRAFTSPKPKNHEEIKDALLGIDRGKPPPNPPLPNDPDFKAGPGPKGGDDTPIDPEKKLIDALKKAKPLNAEQRKAYHAERQKRSEMLSNIQRQGGSKRNYYAQLKSLKGELPKIDYESVLKDFSEEDFNILLSRVTDSPKLLPYEKVTAQGALIKMLGGEGVSLPTTGEIRLLNEIFSPDLIKELLKNQTAREKFWSYFSNAINVPRSLMASFDLSAPFRQGVFMVGRKEFWKAWGTMFKSWGDQKAYDAAMRDIHDRPSYQLMRKSGLAFSDPNSHILDEREEQFMSNWAEKIPMFVGSNVKRSNRAYSAFLNKVRADVFDDLVRKGNEVGVDFKNNEIAAEDLARFVNAATGRGSLNMLLGKHGDAAAPVLSGIFFSPRLMASRLSMLNPYFYGTLDPFVRKEALKSLLTFGSIASTVLGLASLGGAEVETDPRSSDFAKAKVGNTRFDVLGGFQQYLRFFAQFASGQSKTLKGDVKDLKRGFGKETRFTKFIDFLRSKAAPVPAYVGDWMDGENLIGEEFKPVKDAVESFIPLFAQDMAEAIEEYGAEGALTTVPAIFGVGVQTYEPKKAKKKSQIPDDVKDLLGAK